MEVLLIPTSTHQDLRSKTFHLRDKTMQLARMTARIAFELIDDQKGEKERQFLNPLKNEINWVCAYSGEMRHQDAPRAVKLHRLAHSLGTEALRRFVDHDLFDPRSIRNGIGIAEYAGRILNYAVFKLDPNLIPPGVVVGGDDIGAFLESLEGAYRYWEALWGPEKATEQLYTVIREPEREGHE